VIKVKSVIKVTQSRKLQTSTADRRWIVPDLRRVGGNVLRKSCGGTSSGIVWGYELRVRGYERHGSFEGLTLQPSKLRRASLDVIEQRRLRGSWLTKAEWRGDAGMGAGCLQHSPRPGRGGRSFRAEGAHATPRPV
jgi:hypothetical protein